VTALLSRHSISTIKVPPSQTSSLQPLDISVNGPFKQIRERLANERRWNEISVLDNEEETVQRAAKAWLEIPSEAITKGWITACPPLEGRI
jgi:hypothetical protein